MLSDNELPPLPESFTILSRLQSGTEEVVPLDVVREYGRACKRAAYERAAQECETVKSKGGWEDYDDACQDCIDAIRALGRQL